MGLCSGQRCGVCPQRAVVILLESPFLYSKKEKTTLRAELVMLLKTYAAYALTGILLNNLLSCLWIEYFDISKYVAPLINLVISVPLNFAINKFWTFS